MSIKKIAEMVGVSPSTVSRVLNKPEYQCSSDELRRKIYTAARELNYVPNQMAQGLRSGTMQQEHPIHLCIIATYRDNANPFFTELINNIESEIHKNSCILSDVLYRSEYSDESSDNIEATVRSVNDIETADSVDGIIVVGKCSAIILEKLKKQWRNIVVVNHCSSDFAVDEVFCDGEKIARKAITHLIGLGHRKIAFVGECQGESRFRGYQKTMLENGLDISLEHIIRARASESDGYRAMERIMQMDSRPTGIYCSNDIIAIGLLKALKKSKNRFYDPSIISSDDISESAYTDPMLTTVNVPKTEIARFAVITLLDRINGNHRNAVKLEVDSTLIVRGSCFSASSASPMEYYI